MELLFKSYNVDDDFLNNKYFDDDVFKESCDSILLINFSFP